MQNHQNTTNTVDWWSIAPQENIWQTLFQKNCISLFAEYFMLGGEVKV